MTDVAAAARRTFSSLRIRNFRLYFTGQLISVSGTWMQSVAQAWLVLQLTGSGTALGITGALQTLPVLLLAPLGGVVADRYDKRRLLFVTQSTAAVLAVLLGVLVISDVVQLWMVYALAFGFGLVVAVDNPTRQTFTLEMVGPDDLTNAVSLNSVIVNLGRVIGPAVAAILIAVVGLGPCFVLNGASYLAVIIALALMHTRELQRSGDRARGRGKLIEGFRYVRSHPQLWIPLAMMATIGMLTYEFRVTLPLIAKFSFGGDAGTYALMTTSMGLGAVVGGLGVANRGKHGLVPLSFWAMALGVTTLGATVAPSFVLELAALFLVGVASISFIALGNATLQLTASPEMRGRVMGLWTVAFLGSTPIGGPIVGWLGEHIDPRVGLGTGAVAALVCGTVVWWVAKRWSRSTEVGRP
jgi:MFS family permease